MPAPPYAATCFLSAAILRADADTAAAAAMLLQGRCLSPPQRYLFHAVTLLLIRHC